MLSDSDAHQSSTGTLYKKVLPNMKEEIKEQQQRPSQISLRKNPTMLRESSQPCGEQDTLKVSGGASKKVSNSLKKELLPVI